MDESATVESCGLRHGIPFGVVPEISEEGICPRRGQGTSGTADSGNMRGVWLYDRRTGSGRGSCARTDIVSSEACDRRSGANNKEHKRSGVVPRVPANKEADVDRGTVGRRLLRPHSRRPFDSADHREIYQASSRVRARTYTAVLSCVKDAPRLAAWEFHWLHRCRLRKPVSDSFLSTHHLQELLPLCICLQAAP